MTLFDSDTYAAIQRQVEFVAATTAELPAIVHRQDAKQTLAAAKEEAEKLVMMLATLESRFV